METHERIIQGRARGELIFVIEDARRIGDLQCGAAAIGARRLKIILADRNRCATGNIGQNAARRIGERRHAAGLAQIARILCNRARLVVRGVAIGDRLSILAVIQHALQRRSIRDIQ